MTADIKPLGADEIPELGRFLTEEFHTAADAEFAAPDVLRWKYSTRRAASTSPGVTSCAKRGGSSAISGSAPARSWAAPCPAARSRRCT